MQEVEFRWKKFGDYAITANGYSVTKCRVKDKDIFVLWELPENIIGYYDNANEAKRNAVLHNETKPARSDKDNTITRYISSMASNNKAKKAR